MHRPHDSRTADDPVEELLAGVLELDEAAQQGAIDELCQRHPERATDLREHYALYRKLLEGEVPADGDQFGDYQLLRPLGSGGMGTVWLARQRREGVDRTVALKMIRGGGLRSPEARERFRREARAAFRVEHPAICAVYDVGEVDGTPYIAMRHVPGCTLADLIADARNEGRPLTLPSPDAATPHASTARSPRSGPGGRHLGPLLEFFETLALALHTAHEAGLVHRDVKPGNVMVTPAGEPVLLDFGLVRVDGDDSQLTLSDQPLGTPAYMAPEQITPHGRTADRTVDVYGLGATLYECVTLEPPFRAETREGLYRAILESDPRHARRVVRSLPKDLDAILETAMRKEPARRYASALEFGEDLRALRDLQPVRARAAGPIARTGMWMRRNPLATFTLALLAIALALVIRQERATERVAQEAIRQERAAERSAQEARASRERAERGLTLARGAIDELVRTARDRLRDVPRVRDVRRALLERALVFHADLANELADDPSVLDDVAQAWEAASSIQIELARVDAAREAIEHAEAAVTARDQAERSPASRAGLARVAAARALVERAAGRFAEAQAALTFSLEIFREFHELREPLPRELLAHAGAEVVCASVQHSAGQTDDALTSLDRAAALIAAARETDTDAVAVAANEETAREAALRAKIARDIQQFEVADREFARSIDALRRLAAQDPDSRTHRYSLATTLLARSRMRNREARYDDALADADIAAELIRELVRAFPGSATYATALATAWNNRYTILMRLDRREEAATALRDALELLEDVLAATPTAHESTIDLSTVIYNLGNLVRRTDGPPAAVGHYERALTLLRALIESRPDEIRLLSRAGAAAENAAICYLVMGQPVRADELLASAREFLQERLERTPDDPRALRDLGRLRFNEGARAFEEADLERAAAIFDEARSLRERLVAQNPGNVRLQYDVTLTHARLAVVLAETDPERAHQIAAAALARLDALPTELRDRVGREVAVRSYIGALHLVAAGTGDPVDAPAQLRRAWELLEIARDDARIGSWARADALVAAVGLAELASREQRVDDAHAHVADAIAIVTPLAAAPPSGRDVRRALGPRLDRLAALLDELGSGLGSDDEARDIVLAARNALIR